MNTYLIVAIYELIGHDNTFWIRKILILVRYSEGKMQLKQMYHTNLIMYIDSAIILETSLKYSSVEFYVEELFS